MTWEGYELETGIYKEYEYGIVFPEKEAIGRPYIWRTEFFGAFPSVDLAMLKEGYAIVYYRVSDMYGSPKAVVLMEAFQSFIQEKYALSARAVLFGFSRGGLYALHYGAKYPERIAVFIWTRRWWISTAGREDAFRGKALRRNGRSAGSFGICPMKTIPWRPGEPIWTRPGSS